MSTINYLDRMLQPVTEAMSPEFANKLVGTLTTLALILLFWPMISALLAKLRGKG